MKSLGARAAWAAFASAGLAAAVAAVASSIFASALVASATDQRLEAAAGDLLYVLAERRASQPLGEIVDDEQKEASGSGVRIALYDSQGAYVAGDRGFALTHRCRTVDALRVCSVRAPDGHEALAAIPYESNAGLLGLAALAAATLAGCVAWAIARVSSQRAVAPLTRLRSRITGLPLATGRKGALPAVELGADEGVSEVDDLRAALRLVLSRMQESVARSSRFATNAAHELRTPLTTLRAELELLAEDPALGERSTGLATALRKVDQLHTLTERLLLLATPEENTSNFELISLRDVIDDAIADLPPAQRECVRTDDSADIFLHGDAPALRIVVSNGLSNALKFGTKAELALRREGAVAVLTIDDDGPGVPEADRENVFEPFVRAAGHTKPGHGVGLALVAHVARWHSGEARLGASPSDGARLEVRLPIGADR